MSGGRYAAASFQRENAGRRPAFDATSVFTLYVILLLWIPSRLVLAPLGAAGTPAQMLGMLLLLWWGANWVCRTYPEPDVQMPQPVLRATLLFAGAVLASYVAAAMRPIDAVELSSADRGLLSLCAWIGVVVLAAQRIPSQDRLDVLLRRVVAAGAVVATLGLIQFLTSEELTNYIEIPGLTLNAALDSVMSRQGFTRPAGTAIHPIEFGVAVTMILPLALHYAFRDFSAKGVRVWFPPAAISLAVLLSVSRSAVLAAAIVILFLIPTWNRTRRRVAYVLLLLLFFAVYVSIPGLLGTFRDLFLGIQNDDSAASRTDSYGLAWEFIQRDPLFGRGFGTFLPSYRILDNQYLGTVIETGIVGLICLLTLFATGVATGVRLHRRSRDRTTGDLAQSLAAAIAAGACSFATFDAFAFPMTTGLVFLFLGCVAALRRLVVADGGVSVVHALEPVHDALPATTSALDQRTTAGDQARGMKRRGAPLPSAGTTQTSVSAD